MPVIAPSKREEELEKRLGAALLAGQSLISIDNVAGELGGAALCQAIERRVLDIRILGMSKLIRVEPRGVCFYATGNNIVLVGDICRRAILVTLDHQMERPELHQFAGDPVAQILVDRGRYIAACLTICRAYIAAGKPYPASKLASFEDWSDTVRSALMWLGEDDPVATMETAHEEDPERIALQEITRAWADAIGTGFAKSLTAPQILKMTEECQGDKYQYPELREAITSGVPHRSKVDARALGYWLRRNKGRIVDGRRLKGTTPTGKHTVGWYVEEV